MHTVIVSAPLPGTAVARLTTAGHRVIQGDQPGGLGHEGIIRVLRDHPDTSALIPLVSDRVDARVLDAGPSLRIVANYGVGIDNLDLVELKRRGIVATNTPGVLTEATADFAMALILDACRNVSRGDRLVRAGLWKGWSPTQLLGPRVTGSTLGIVGFGRIGQAVAARARGFSMRVLYSDPIRVSPQIEKDLQATYLSLGDLLAQSDIVSLHCPSTDSTRGLMNETRLRQMRPGSVLVNTGRGTCVEEAALAKLLKEGHLAAAGLDVYEREPMIHQELLDLPNVVLAPHLGSADLPAREGMAELSVSSVIAVLAGNEPAHRVA
ncbi:MAG TPA: D-glycerate dehydrogenase [Polyangiaceae bacterium]|nr:D-glycerate dehydrogenase [Polyangiaceae bacterium]HNZ23901.1 D-glycerate dehydrogenase [Polyangiaceae bacterium]HOD22966.1 D-glycerate dehydrogenase [Polyangiaceae bacterium]HOE49729.1 D-glycerate dehydrogenase [Polyangiaceae bacterium]HOH01749.1 D-glycerate dehydrogenase [Polyangiaceae bacterium]